MYVLVFAWTRKTQILGRCDQRLSGKLSNPQFPLIVRQFHLTGLRSLPQLHRISRPLLKLERWSFSFSGSGHSAFYMRDCTQARWDHFCIYRHTVCGNQHRGRFCRARFSAGDCSSWNTFLRQVKTIDGSFHISGADNSDSSHERNPHREMHRDCQRKLFHRAAQRRLSSGRSRNAFALHLWSVNAHCGFRCCADTASDRL